MASTFHPPPAFAGSLATKASASDLLRSSRSGVCGVPLKALGRARLGSKKRDFAVSAKLRKVKKHIHPWPKDLDPNVKGGVLRHLSPFKPLKEKPKPVILDFEKPLIGLQKKIIDVQKMANETGLDFSDQIISLENKYQQALKDLYKHLTPIQRVNIARHPNRPTFLDHVFNITDQFVELHGDRAGYDDPAIVTGLGKINGQSFMFMGHQKGRNTKENIQRNFGMPTPHGYRKALRMMYYADHHGFPIVTFIDTPGAYADLKSEELGQGEAIAHNLRSMFGLKVPVICIVIGEGGSGGALAIGCGNKLLMLENSVFYVASPEACAAILWKTAKASPKAAERLRITARELCKLQVADGVIPEPLGGAHSDPYWTSQQIKTAILESMDELGKMNTEELLKHRMLKFRKMGTINAFQEGTPVEPKKTANMKKKEVPDVVPEKTPVVELRDEAPEKTPVAELRDEVEKLKEQILKASESSSKIPESGPKEMIEKLKRELDYEYTEAAKFLGFYEKIVTLREEFAKVQNSNDQSNQRAFMEKLDMLNDEFNQKLSAAPNFEDIKYKRDMIKEISEAHNLLAKSNKQADLKQEIDKTYKEIVSRADLKKKIEALKADIKRSGVSTLAELDQGLKDKLAQLKSEIKSEFAAALEPSGLHVVSPSFLDARVKIDSFNSEIGHVMEDVVNSTDLKNKIELLKIEVAKAGKTPDEESKAKIEALKQEIKQSMAEAMNFSELKEKHEKLKSEVSESNKMSGGSDGNLLKGDGQYDKLMPDGSNIEVNFEPNRSFA
ncbi:PREDICTED: acetyl-coenzyme A carboxylase carboxyl transferase subunit alpha, chloroplastic isoform X2 [Ipomoea nil]|uniref:acetyl-coenzyme A carboxylase carboxyl transferase subunit alpha, chloroplastic isoform X2 n=1 Tax=Ipomoea nil TaxID=35883 RepID=UPI000901D9D5|nr:PREDICTED: acetyl-coenzyme A carboxylase carboxyl transferase subunit alpha, chloroplastic isoform X2 [Ipomoea nil]